MTPVSKIAALFDGTGPQEGTLAKQAVQGGEAPIDPETFMSAPGFTGKLNQYNEIRAEGLRYMQAGGKRLRLRSRSKSKSRKQKKRSRRSRLSRVRG